MDAKRTSDEIYGWTSDTVENVADEYSGIQPILIIIGYIMMIAYCGLTFLYFNWVNSHVSVGLVSDKISSCTSTCLQLDISHTIGGFITGGTCFCCSFRIDC